MNQADLKELLDSNPQVDEELLSEAIEQGRNIEGPAPKMVNFDMVVPYASDAPGGLYESTWRKD